MKKNKVGIPKLEGKRCATAVLVICQQSVPLVLAPSKPEPLKWKAPGGRSRAGQVLIEAAIDEVREETGLTLDERQLILVQEPEKGKHLWLFVTDVLDLTGLKSRGDQGEKIKVFSLREVLEIENTNFLPSHEVFRQIIRERIAA
jgi:ADP-ribose pyrophosphatase YjhB (NUDIX family)